MNYKCLSIIIIVVVGHLFLSNVSAQGSGTYVIKKYCISSGFFDFNSDNSFFHYASMGAPICTNQMGDEHYLLSGYWVSSKNLAEEPTTVLFPYSEKKFQICIYPNPLSANAKLKFSFPQTARLEVNIYSLNGSYLRSILNRTYDKGKYEYQIYDQFTSLESGIYFIEFTATDPLNGSVMIKKMLKTVVIK